MKKVLLAMVAFFFMCGMAMAVDVNLKWAAAPNSTGYKIYKSLDNGATWDAGIDVGLVTEHIYLGVEETGLVLFRVGAYNAAGEAISYWSGAFYNYLWMPPLTARGLGVGDVS